jgi:hypothetical protein
MGQLGRMSATAVRRQRPGNMEVGRRPRCALLFREDHQIVALVQSDSSSKSHFSSIASHRNPNAPAEVTFQIMSFAANSNFTFSRWCFGQNKNEVGEYVFLNCRELALFEWHPFTLTSAPGVGNLPCQTCQWQVFSSLPGRFSLPCLTCHRNLNGRFLAGFRFLINFVHFWSIFAVKFVLELYFIKILLFL